MSEVPAPALKEMFNEARPAFSWSSLDAKHRLSNSDRSATVPAT